MTDLTRTSWREPEMRDLSQTLQIKSPEHELYRLLGLAGLPEPMAVGPVAEGYAAHFGMRDLTLRRMEE